MTRSRHLRTALRFLAHRYRDLHPYEVQAQLLNACNTRCVYCACPEVKSSQLSTEQWLSVIRGLGRLGTLRLKFQGGEPTLHRDFRRLCLEARRESMISATVSNGFMIVAQPDLLDYLDELVISLDSTRPEINDRLRGEGSYLAAVQAIDLARERGLRVFVNMALCRENVAGLEAMLEFCEALGIEMNAQPVVFGRLYYDAKAQAIGLTHKEIRRVHLQLARWKREGRALLFSASAYLKAASWPDTSLLTIRSPGNSPCLAGRLFVHIEPNGDVLPCIQHGADFRPKNVLADGLEEALRHVRLHDCGDCWAAYLNERRTLFALRPGALREFFRRG